MAGRNSFGGSRFFSGTWTTKSIFTGPVLRSHLTKNSTAYFAIRFNLRPWNKRIPISVFNRFSGNLANPAKPMVVQLDDYLIALCNLLQSPSCPFPASSASRLSSKLESPRRLPTHRDTLVHEPTSPHTWIGAFVANYLPNGHYGLFLSWSNTRLDVRHNPRLPLRLSDSCHSSMALH